MNPNRRSKEISHSPDPIDFLSKLHKAETQEEADAKFLLKVTVANILPGEKRSIVFINSTDDVKKCLEVIVDLYCKHARQWLVAMYIPCQSWKETLVSV